MDLDRDSNDSLILDCNESGGESEITIQLLPQGHSLHQPADFRLSSGTDIQSVYEPAALAVSKERAQGSHVQSVRTSGSESLPDRDGENSSHNEICLEVAYNEQNGEWIAIENQDVADRQRTGDNSMSFFSLKNADSVYCSERQTPHTLQVCKDHRAKLTQASGFGRNLSDANSATASGNLGDLSQFATSRAVALHQTCPSDCETVYDSGEEREQERDFEHLNSGTHNSGHTYRCDTNTKTVSGNKHPACIAVVCKGRGVFQRVKPNNKEDAVVVDDDDDGVEIVKVMRGRQSKISCPHLSIRPTPSQKKTVSGQQETCVVVDHADVSPITLDRGSEPRIGQKVDSVFCGKEKQRPSVKYQRFRNTQPNKTFSSRIPGAQSMEDSGGDHEKGYSEASNKPSSHKRSLSYDALSAGSCPAKMKGTVSAGGIPERIVSVPAETISASDSELVADDTAHTCPSRGWRHQLSGVPRPVFLVESIGGSFRYRKTAPGSSWTDLGNSHQQAGCPKKELRVSISKQDSALNEGITCKRRTAPQAAADRCTNNVPEKTTPDCSQSKDMTQVGSLTQSSSSSLQFNVPYTQVQVMGSSSPVPAGLSGRQSRDKDVSKETPAAIRNKTQADFSAQRKNCDAESTQQSSVPLSSRPEETDSCRTTSVMFPLSIASLHQVSFQKHLGESTLCPAMVAFLQASESRMISQCSCLPAAVEDGPVVMEWGKHYISGVKREVLMVLWTDMVRECIIDYHITTSSFLDKEKYPAVWSSLTPEENSHLIRVRRTKKAPSNKTIVSLAFLMYAFEAFLLYSTDVTTAVRKRVSQILQDQVCIINHHKHKKNRACAVGRVSPTLGSRGRVESSPVTEKTTTISVGQKHGDGGEEAADNRPTGDAEAEKISSRLVYPGCPCVTFSPADKKEKEAWQTISIGGNKVLVDNLGVLRFMGKNVFTFREGRRVFMSLAELTARELLPSSINLQAVVIDFLPMLPKTEIRRPKLEEKTFTIEFFPVPAELDQMVTPSGLNLIYRHLSKMDMRYRVHMLTLFYRMKLGHHCSWTLQVTPPTSQLHQIQGYDHPEGKCEPAAMLLETRVEKPMEYFDGGGGTPPIAKGLPDCLLVALIQTIRDFGLRIIAQPYCSCSLNATNLASFTPLAISGVVLYHVTEMHFAGVSHLHCWKRSHGFYVSVAELQHYGLYPKHKACPKVLGIVDNLMREGKSPEDVCTMMESERIFLSLLKPPSPSGGLGCGGGKKQTAGGDGESSEECITSSGLPVLSDTGSSSSSRAGLRIVNVRSLSGIDFPDMEDVMDMQEIGHTDSESVTSSMEGQFLKIASVCSLAVDKSSLKGSMCSERTKDSQAASDSSSSTASKETHCGKRGLGGEGVGQDVEDELLAQSSHTSIEDEDDDIIQLFDGSDARQTEQDKEDDTSVSEDVEKRREMLGAGSKNRPNELSAVLVNLKYLRMMYELIAELHPTWAALSKSNFRIKHWKHECSEEQADDGDTDPGICHQKAVPVNSEEGSHSVQLTHPSVGRSEVTVLGEEDETCLAVQSHGKELSEECIKVEVDSCSSPSSKDECSTVSTESRQDSSDAVKVDVKNAESFTVVPETSPVEKKVASADRSGTCANSGAAKTAASWKVRVALRQKLTTRQRATPSTSGSAGTEGLLQKLVEDGTCQMACSCVGGTSPPLESVPITQCVQFPEDCLQICTGVGQAIIRERFVWTFRKGNTICFSLFDLKQSGLVKRDASRYALTKRDSFGLKTCSGLELEFLKEKYPGKQLTHSLDKELISLEAFCELSSVQLFLNGDAAISSCDVHLHRVGHICPDAQSLAWRVQQKEYPQMSKITSCWVKSFQWQKSKDEQITDGNKLVFLNQADLSVRFVEERAIRFLTVNTHTPSSSQSASAEHSALECFLFIRKCMFSARGTEVDSFFHLLPLTDGQNIPYIILRGDPYADLSAENPLCPRLLLGKCICKPPEITDLQNSQVLEAVLVNGDLSEVQTLRDTVSLEKGLGDMCRSHTVILAGVLRSKCHTLCCFRLHGKLYVNWWEIMKMFSDKDRSSIYNVAHSLHIFLYCLPVYITDHFCRHQKKHTKLLARNPWVCMQSLFAIYHWSAVVAASEGKSYPFAQQLHSEFLDSHSGDAVFSTIFLLKKPSVDSS